MVKTKHLLGFIVALMIVPAAIAQKDKKEKSSKKINPNRLEIEVESKNKNCTVIPLDSNGLLLFYETDKNEYNVTRYNTRLKKEWNTAIALEKNQRLVEYVLHGEQVYMLFANASEYTGNGKSQANGPTFKEYNMIMLNIETKRQSNVTYKFEKTFMLTKMMVDDEQIFLFGNSTIKGINQSLRTCYTYLMCCIPMLWGAIDFEHWPVIHSINQKTKETNTELLVMNKRNRSLLLSSQINSDDNNGNLLIKTQLSRKEYKTYVKPFKYSAKGGAATDQEWELNMEPGKEVSYAVFNTLNEKEKVMIGSYGSTKAKLKVSGLVAAISPEGVFISKVNGQKQQYMKYYGFNDFKAYKTEFLGARTQKNLEKSKDKGKNATIGRYLLFHNMIQADDQLIMVAETYYPTYHTEYYTTYVNGKPQTQSRTVFDGFVYEAGIIAGFGLDGKLLWDDAFSLPWFRTFNLNKRLIRVSIAGDDLAFSVFSGRSLETRILKEDHLSRPETDQLLTKGKKGDKVKSVSSNVEFWYDGHYIAYGFANIRNTKNTKKEGKDRSVIFLEKIDLMNIQDEEEDEDEDE